MSNTFTGYTDAFATAVNNEPEEKLSLKALAKALKKAKKKNKKLKRDIKERREAEDKRLAEEQRASAEALLAEERRNAEEAKAKEKSFLSKLGETILKAIPTILAAFAGSFMKGFFSRMKASVFA